MTDRPVSLSAADTVIVNGNVLTVDAEFSSAEAIAVKDNRIVAVGRNDAVLELAGSATKVLDIDGATVIPGIIDPHGHIGTFGMEKHFVDLNGARSVREICARIRERAQQVPAGTVIVTTPVGDGPYFFNVPGALEEGRFPTRRELDEAAPEHPVYITAPTNRIPNSAVFNSLAFELAGITADSVPAGNPNRVQIRKDAYWLDGIEIPRDPATGEPTGELRTMNPLYPQSSYFDVVTGFVPKPTYEFVREGIRLLAPDFVSLGTTTLLENHLTSPEELRAYAELDLPLRVFYTVELDPNRPMAELEELVRAMAFAAGKGFGNDRVGIAGVSIGLDGPHWQGTAVLDEPYVGPFGDLVSPGTLAPVEAYRAVVRLAARYGLRIHGEAAGRGAIQIFLDTMAELDRETPIADRRFILEHCEFPTREQIAECKRLGIIPTTATNFIWGKGDEVYLDRLGPDYAENAIPLRWWLDAGVPVCQETDWGPRSPMFTIWESITRQTGLTGKTIGAHQSITREEALRIFTMNCAYALFMEDKLGSIETGKLADLAVLSADPMTCAENDIKDIDVIATMMDGKVVHARDDFPA
ncbi:amidohydrolase [Pseudonocardia asaccharolytica]|uniref:Amidohydrolase n=1 Tax=Pseudonocardia asaccharolytica DSM 44247 = NBRC 16224 TaxID=1123024 RepID=A0A511CY81_9PSEU|nr:amidohydrolase [Pseudonocardia asaccharolytica]GEL17203.1 amidohydrolase [Pseudonocardia asaccharolytica DSM 44247 = NBRC 16224]